MIPQFDINNPAQSTIDFINTIYATPALDVVGVYDSDFNQLFKDARPLKATVKPVVKLMEQPIESGVVITDHRILLPIEIELSLVFLGSTYRDTYNEIWDLKNSSMKLVVQTQARTYENMVIQEMPSEESAAIFNTITMALKLKEVQIAVTKSTIVPRNKNNSDTIDRGQVQPAVPSAPKDSAAKDLFNPTKKVA